MRTTSACIVNQQHACKQLEEVLAICGGVLEFTHSATSPHQSDQVPPRIQAGPDRTDRQTITSFDMHVVTLVEHDIYYAESTAGLGKSLLDQQATSQ